MVTPTEVLRFFHSDRILTTIPTFGDFMLKNQGRILAPHLKSLIEKLKLEGYLLERGGDWENNPNNARFQTVNFDPKKAVYGYYDFHILGFPHVLKEFSRSVLYLHVKLPDGSETIGTSFFATFINERYVLTAKHNILGGKFRVFSHQGTELIVTDIWTTCEDGDIPNNKFIDIAILKISSPLLKIIKPFQLDQYELLDNILTIGYPPIPGFDAIQIAETASIAGSKSTVGHISGEGTSYIGKQDFFLISARIKGGNSGGPVINKFGKVVGMVTETPEKDGVIDSLGYGVVTPYLAIINVLQSIIGTDRTVSTKKLKFSYDMDGWIIL
jgi:serine protease Do